MSLIRPVSGGETAAGGRGGGAPTYKSLGRARSDRPTAKSRTATGRERSAPPGSTPPISRVRREPPRRQAEGGPAQRAGGRSPQKLSVGQFSPAAEHLGLENGAAESGSILILIL